MTHEKNDTFLKLGELWLEVRNEIIEDLQEDKVNYEVNIKKNAFITIRDESE